VTGQELSSCASIELVVCDSGSRDGSVGLARRFGAEVIEIAPGEFSHGRTRNLLMRHSSGDHVAFLTQDSVPGGSRWLERLLGGFAAADDVALVFGPYQPRPEASPMVRRELAQWFGSFSPDGSVRVDRLAAAERSLPAGALVGVRGYYTDANGCVARDAWESVPFRDVPYAEDHVLAHDMMRAGYAKAYVPDAAVVHSHNYRGWELARRSFDEARAIKQVYGFSQSWSPRRVALNLWGLVGADWRWLRATQPGHVGARDQVQLLVRSLLHHSISTAGALLGGRSERIPGAATRRLSLEGRQ
jgi:glycosyltransferase involved in cell wall biosynthesis